MMETVFILLPVHDRREVTRRFVECLATQTHPACILLLLDDGSTDGTAEMVRARIPSTVVIRGDGHWWWAGALQQGYAWLRERAPRAEDLVLIMNDDTEFEPDFVARGVEFMRGRRRALLLAHAHDRETDELVDRGCRVDWRRLRFDPAATDADLGCLSTRGLFLNAREFLFIGGFRPRLLPHYLSDYEFTIRARRKGWSLCTDPSIRLKLDRSTTGFREDQARSFIAFLRQYFSRRATANPVTWSAFVALACPWPWKAVHLVAIWAGAGRAVLRAAVRAP